MNLGIINSFDAYAHGLRPLAGPYKPSEKWMLDNVIADMRRGRRKFATVTYGKSSSNVHVFVAPIATPVRTADSLE